MGGGGRPARPRALAGVVRVALSTRIFGGVPAPDRLAERLRELDVRQVFFHMPPGQARAVGEALRAAGVESVGALSADGTPATLAAAARSASRLRAGTVVCDAGVCDAAVPRERQVEALARALHALLREGAPVAVLPGDVGPALLDDEGLTWLLEDLPGVGLWLDPLHVVRRERAEEGAGLVSLLDRYAGRCRGTFVAGLGSDGQGGRHPEDDGPDWNTLAALLPRGIPWVLDLDPQVQADELEDAIRYLRHIAAG